MQFRCLASQMHPNDFYWLINAFHDATAKPHGYLVLEPPKNLLRKTGRVEYFTRKRFNILQHPLKYITI